MPDGPSEFGLAAARDGSRQLKAARASSEAPGPSEAAAEAAEPASQPPGPAGPAEAATKTSLEPGCPALHELCMTNTGAKDEHTRSKTGRQLKREQMSEVAHDVLQEEDDILND